MGSRSNSPSRLPKRDRQMTVDWFQCPPTDYVNVSSLKYPRGLQPTIAEIDENSTLVEVLRRKGSEGSFINSSQRKADSIITLYLEADIDSLRDSNTSNTKFVKLYVRSKQLLDAIKPAIDSVDYVIPNTNECGFVPPFDGPFFAQGRIIETLKHGNARSAKNKELRSFVTALRVVLECINEKVREMANKKIIDFDHVWTLFPPGSFATWDSCGTTGILQVVRNTIIAIHEEVDKDSVCFGFTSFGFDGCNIITYTDDWKVRYFQNHVSVASLKYHPLKFEERANPSVVKDAIANGRKFLDYQSHHYRHYIGLAHPVSAVEGQSAFDIKINGRVIVDSLQARKTKAIKQPFFDYEEFKITPIPGKTQEMYEATRPFFLTGKPRRPTVDEQARRRMFYSSRDEYLMLFKPLLPGFSLEHGRWYWLRISGLSPVSFREDPMGCLIDSNQRSMGLLNLLIQRKLSTTPKDNGGKGQGNALQRTALVTMFSGSTGTGKTATAEAIADLHGRPLVKFRMPRFGASCSTQRSEFVNLLELATAWNAFVLLKDTQLMFGQDSDGSSLIRCEMAHDFASMIRHFPGIVIMSRRGEERIIDDMSCQIQVGLEFKQFSKEKRFKIWKALCGSTQKGTPDCAALSAVVGDDLLHRMSKWELNGHEIQHLFQNILLLRNNLDEKGMTFADIDELRALTWSPSTQTVAVRDKGPIVSETQALDDETQD